MKGDYTSAATMPVKLFHNDVIKEGKIIPYHVTLIPTNKCNADCDECFCSNRNKSASLYFDEVRSIVDNLKTMGTRAISLSGGGEPDCHPMINEIIDYIDSSFIDVALTGNGKSFYNIKDETLNKLKWVRVSGTSSRPVNLEKLTNDMKRGNKVDWGMSYVLGNETEEFANLQNSIYFTENSDLTHLRIVSNMMNPGVDNLERAKSILSKTGDKIIWQSRTKNKKGTKNCYNSLLHPIIDAEGNVQPCCGIHFATTPPTYDFGKETAICHWRDYKDFVKKQIPYDGTKCDICQYDDYNKTLEMLLTKPEHETFV